MKWVSLLASFKYAFTSMGSFKATRVIKSKFYVCYMRFSSSLLQDITRCGAGIELTGRNLKVGGLESY